MTRTWMVLGLTAAAGLACSGVTTGVGTQVTVVRAGVVDPDWDAKVAVNVAKELEDRGFRVVLVPDAILLDEDTHDAARSLAGRSGSANAVVLQLSTHEERAGVLDGTSLHVVTLQTAVIATDAAHPVSTDTLEFASEAVLPGEVEARTASHWADGAAAFAIRTVFQSPGIAAVLDTSVKLPIDELSAANELRKRERQVADSVTRAFEYEQYCKAEAAKVAAFATDEGLSCWGDPCGGATLLGVTQTHVVVQESSRKLVFDVPVKKTPEWSEPPERLISMALDGDHAEQWVLRAQNLYGVGNVPAGAAVGTADWFSAERHNAIVGFDVGTGSIRSKTLLPEGERSDLSAVAADGSATVYCVNKGGCWIATAAGRSELPLFKTGAWVNASGTPMFVGETDEGIVSVTVTGEVSKPARLKGRLQQVVQGEEAVHVMVRDDSDCVWSPLTLPNPVVGKGETLPGCPWQLKGLGHGFVAMADATAGADDVPGDAEVVRWAPGDKAFTVLTQGGYREEFPMPTPGARVVFNRRLEPAPAAFDTRVYRRVLCSMPL